MLVHCHVQRISASFSTFDIVSSDITERAQFNKLEIDQLAMDAKRVRFPSKYPRIGPASASGSGTDAGGSEANAKGLTVDTAAAAAMTRSGQSSARGSSSRLTPFK